ncbi:MAG: hypothetical protein DRJ31_04960 [Candidatus Methanomethylicota archaeon]|uniref:NurA domain-containing protein n=1 Tax=Thermoproteota archaeon TaxID=2056631 RepID=A0A497EPV5_9CREN|nr:MAG: hypothetical protein DRJ31_04960 [Candidatus Verstraetearchaeota archaeon]RLE53515.1 MAG: hypothetical protein DRJ33_00770 [Candidatus Verstraetearchaeota archaeon]
MAEEQMPEAEVEELSILASPPALVSVLRKTREKARDELAPKIEEAAKLARVLRSKLEVREVGGLEAKFKTVAVDSTYTIPHLELIGGKLAVIVTGYVVAPREAAILPHYPIADVVFSDKEVGFENLVSRKSKEMELKIAIGLLKMKREGKADFDLLALDGRILPPPHPYFTVHNVAKKFIKLAKETKTTVIGVVKRAHTRYLSTLAGREMPVNDKVVMSWILGPGEYVSLGKLFNIIPNYVKYLVENKEEKRYVKTLEKHPELGEVEVFFYKSKMPTLYRQATKVELLNYGELSVDELMAYLINSTSPNGVPFFIDQVDEYVRFEARALGIIQQIIEAELAKLRGVEGFVFSGYTNPQKAYLFRPPEV